MASSSGLDWFEALTGFKETNFQETRAKLSVDGTQLRSAVNGRSYSIGVLETPSLSSLRERAPFPSDGVRRLKTSIVRGDVGALHRDRANNGALFQVASQFNLLEMVSPEVSPADGVARYAHDRTQGPACAIAAGAATIYRNYFAQTPDAQIDCAADLGAQLRQIFDVPQQALWTMRNGYAMPNLSGLERIGKFLSSAEETERDELRALLRIGTHVDVEVTDRTDEYVTHVSQAFCSAMPVSYSYIDEETWEPLALLTLEAAYEATLRAAILNSQRQASNVVYLTMLGGGAFGNKPAWIVDAIERALTLAEPANLDVRLVSFGTPWRRVVELFDRS